jgi:hypothetical protein
MNYSIVLSSTSTGNEFTNVTTDIEEFVPGGSELTRKWFYKLHVNDSDGNDVVANIIGKNITGTTQFTETTDSSGLSSIHELTEYFNDGGSKSYFNNYSINVSNSSYLATPKVVAYNLTGNDIDHYVEIEVDGLRSCGTLNQANTVYTLYSDITTSGTCFNITANNITINCQNNWINGSKIQGQRAFENFGYNYIKIINCNIKDFGTDDDGAPAMPPSAIHFENSYYHLLENITIANSVTIYEDGIYFSNVSNSTIKNVSIRNVGCSFGNNCGYPIRLKSSSNYNVLTDINSSNNGYGIYIRYSKNLNLTNIIVNSNTQSGIDASNMNDSIIENIVANSNYRGIYLSGKNSNNTFTNITTNLNGIGFESHY